MAIPMGKYTIKAKNGHYLSMDNNGFTSPSSGGGGSVSYSSDCGSESEQFYITPVAEDSNIYTIQSVKHLGLYLRMDGSGMTHSVGSGGGVVNCQVGMDRYEKFRIVYVAGGKHHGKFTIGSQAFPFVHLRADGGVINCQYGAFSGEMYTITAV